MTVMFPIIKSANKFNGYIFVTIAIMFLAYSLPLFATYIKKTENPGQLYLDGKLMRDFESMYDKRFFIRDFSIKFWGSLQYILFKEGQPGVVVGKDGWLFSSEELVSTNNVEQRLAAYSENIIGVREKLKAFNIELLVLPVPLKTVVYQEYVGEIPDEKINTLYLEFSSWLEANSISYINLEEEFKSLKNKEHLYFKKDTHWTPEAANYAANLVGKKLCESECVDLEDDIFVTKVTGEAVINGDLNNFINVFDFINKKLDRTESANIYLTEKVIEDVGEDDLFTDQGVDFVVVGSSYTDDDRWNFMGFLEDATNSNFVKYSNKGKGSFAAMDDFFEKGLSETNEAKYVVWEIPVRSFYTDPRFKPRFSINQNQFF